MHPNISNTLKMDDAEFSESLKGTADFTALKGDDCDIGDTLKEHFGISGTPKKELSILATLKRNRTFRTP